MDKEAASNLDQAPSSNSLSTDKIPPPVKPGLGGGQSEVFCKEVVLRLEAMCQHEDKKPELASGEETTHFQTSTPNNTLEEFQPEGGMGEELQPEGVGKAEDVTPSPVCPADLNILTSSSLASESECYQIPLQARTLRDLTSSLFYPPPPPPSPGVAMGTGATPITPPAAQSPRQSTFVIEPAKDVETASGSTSDSDQTIVNEEPLVPNGIPTEGVDEAATPDQAPPPASVHADEPPSYPLDQQAGVQPLSVPPVQAPSVPPVQPAVVQSQPIVVTQQNTDSANQQTQAAAGMGGWYGGGWGWGWSNQRGTRDAKYLVLSTVLLVISCFNPVLFICAVPAFIGAIVALVEGQNNTPDDMMMMGGVPGGAPERENELGQAMNLCSLVCSVGGLVLCCLMLVAAVCLLIAFLVLGKALFTAAASGLDGFGPPPGGIDDFGGIDGFGPSLPEMEDFAMY